MCEGGWVSEFVREGECVCEGFWVSEFVRKGECVSECEGGWLCEL